MNKYYEQFMKDNDLQVGEIFKIVDSQGGGNVLATFTSDKNGSLSKLIEAKGNFNSADVIVGLLRGNLKAVKIKGLSQRDVAKEPILKRVHFNASTNGDFKAAVLFVCPTCGATVENDSNYCFNCGQKLDWGKREIEK